MKIYHISIVNNKLGWGNRLVFWLSGCPFHCLGCIEPKLQSGMLGKYLKIDGILEMIKDNLEVIDGITFTGGEPLYQEKRLQTLLECLPKGIDTMIFSGYDFNELNNIQKKCYDSFDLAVMGKYDMNKRGNYLWRGSKNQLISSPTGKYTSIVDKINVSEGRGLEVRITNKTIMFYGIPTSQDEIKIITEELFKRGLEIRTN